MCNDFLFYSIEEKRLLTTFKSLTTTAFFLYSDSIVLSGTIIKTVIAVFDGNDLSPQNLQSPSE